MGWSGPCFCCPTNDGCCESAVLRALDVAFGSKPEKLNASICFPLFTQQRTSPRYFGMSVSCQLRKWSSHLMAPLERFPRGTQNGDATSNRNSGGQLFNKLEVSALVSIRS